MHAVTSDHRSIWRASRANPHEYFCKRAQIRVDAEIDITAGMIQADNTGCCMADLRN
jgi:hypothetical protein